MSTANQPAKILIVDDEPHLAEAVAEGLAAEGYVTTVRSDGASGLEEALQGHYDVIVLDILLPGVNGYQICSQLRAEGVMTPILMLTAKDGEFDEAEALDTGAEDFLSKPFSFVVLTARIRALLRRSSPDRTPAMTVGDLVLDPARHRCWRGDAEIALTPREFDLLACLMRAAGDVVSKPDLLNDVWGDDFEGDPNIVEVYAGYLRRKIDVPHGRESLQTVRGIGYRLDPSVA